MRILKISKVNTFLFGIIMMAILLCCSSQVQAAQSGDYTYTVTAGKAQISKYTGAGGDVTIPSKLGGSPVTSIGYRAFQTENVENVFLTSVSIPQGVTSIDDFAFCYCSGLTSINIPQGLTSIGMMAFARCSGLTSISIPNGVTSIGYAAFDRCTGLTSITFNSATTAIETIEADDANTIPATTKIIGYDPSTAKDYATKYNRTFEVIGTAPDTTGMTEMKTTTPTVGPSKIWTIKLNGLVNEASIKDNIYITNSQGTVQASTCTVTTDNGLSQIEVKPETNYTPDDYILWVSDIESSKGSKIKNRVYLKFKVQ